MLFHWIILLNTVCVCVCVCAPYVGESSVDPAIRRDKNQLRSNKEQLDAVTVRDGLRAEVDWQCTK